MHGWKLVVALWLASALSVLAESSMLGYISRELREAEGELSAKRRTLVALGEPVVGQTVPQFGFQHLQMPAPPPEAPFLQLDLGSTQRIDSVALVPALVDFQPIARGAYGFPRRFRVDVSDDATFGSFIPLLVHTDEDFSPPGVAPVVIPAYGLTGRYLRVTVTRLAQESGVFFYAMAEVIVLQGNRNVALGAKVFASNSATLPPRWSPAYLVDGRTPLGPPINGSELPSFDAFFAALPPDGRPAWIGLDLGREMPVDEVRLHPLHSRQGADVPGFGFPLQFRVELAGRGDFTDADVIFDTGMSEMSERDFPNPGNNPATLRAGGKRGRYVRVVMQKPHRGAQNSFALSELEVYSGDENVARRDGVRPITSADPDRRETRPGELLIDGFASYGRILELPQWLEIWAKRSRTGSEIASLTKRLPALEAEARRRAVWIGIGAVVVLATGSIALWLRSRKRRAKEQDRFRTRLAQDLHDEIGSNLASIARLSEAAAAQSDGTEEDWREVEQIARETTDAMREVLWLVGARAEQGIDIVRHLQLAAARLLRGKRVHWLTVPQELPDSFPSDARRQVFLFFKEALANVARHARASEVELSARADGDIFELMIRDNGRGFSEKDVRAGLGLRGMRERACSLDGVTEFDSAPGRGTRIVLRVPLSPRRNSM